jgi:hypothetical protein
MRKFSATRRAGCDRQTFGSLNENMTPDLPGENMSQPTGIRSRLTKREGRAKLELLGLEVLSAFVDESLDRHSY